PQLEVRALQLFRHRRLALLGVASAHAVGGRLENAVHRVAKPAARLGQRLRARSRDTVSRQPRLEVFRTTRRPSQMADTEDEQEDACKGDQSESYGSGGRLILQRSQYRLSAAGCRISARFETGGSSPSVLLCLLPL